MGQIPTSVTVVTAMVDEEPVAMVIGSFVSVSLNPPLAGFFCTTTSATWWQLRGAEVLGVNVLSADQVDVSKACMRDASERFNGLDWSVVDGAPRFAGISAWLTLTHHEIIEAGDHEFALCKIVHMEAPESPIEPIVHYGGSYRSLAPNS
jgi:flavin reductase (DIM6/NTAB) family NADH-FMN oxidoreductase RutF